MISIIEILEAVIRNQRLNPAALSILSLPLLCADSAICQTIYAGLDFNTPSYEVQFDGDDAARPKSDLPAFSFGWYSNSFRRDSSRPRFGFVVRRSGIKTDVTGPNAQWLKYKATTLQASFDRKLYQTRLLMFSGGAHFGATFVTDEYERNESCNTAFCDMPNGSWSLYPELRATLNLDTTVTAYVAARGQLYSDLTEKDFLFKREVVFSAGVCVQ